MERKNYTSNEIKAKLALLPENVKKILYSSDVDAAIQKIGQKHQLHIDQMGLLQVEVTDVMVGTAQPDEFVPYVMETLEVDKTKADAIAQDVNEMIFEKIRQAMREAVPSPSTPAQSTTQTHPVAPKPSFPAADVMLTQKTVMPPMAATTVSTPTTTHTGLPTIVPPKLQPSTTTPVVIPTASDFVTTPIEPSIPTPPPIPIPAPKQNTYKIDPYREPIE